MSQAIILRQADSLILTNLAIFAGCLAVLLAVIYLVARSITRPIEAAAAFADDIARGDLDAAFALKGQRKDEIGVLVSSLDAMRANLKDMIVRARAKEQECSLEAENAHAAMRQAEAAQAQAQEARRQGILEAAGSLEGIINRLTESAAELMERTEAVGRAVTDQRHRVTAAVTSMSEMTTTVTEVAQNASRAAVSSETARTQASDGANVVSQAIAAIRDVQTRSSSMRVNLNELGHKAESIESVMSVINDIADQTNLLALNAAIEAARAGEAGRGFAVVADEVRKLAEKTMQATREVADSIRGIQDVSRRSIQDMDMASTAVEQATRLADESGSSLKAILGHAEESSAQIRNIATAAEEQSASSEEIGRNIGEISDLAGATSGIMEQSARSIADLADLAEELKSFVDNLKKS